MQHRPVKRFQEKGRIADDSDFIKTRETLDRLMVESMREEGYIPLLDLGPFWSTSLDDDHYNFVLSYYGVFVGKEKAWRLLGMDGSGHFYPASTTQKNKSKQS
jgi:hypothetical protein